MSLDNVDGFDDFDATRDFGAFGDGDAAAGIIHS